MFWKRATLTLVMNAPCQATTEPSMYRPAFPLFARNKGPTMLAAEIIKQQNACWLAICLVDSVALFSPRSPTTVLHKLQPTECLNLIFSLRKWLEAAASDALSFIHLVTCTGVSIPLTGVWSQPHRKVVKILGLVFNERAGNTSMTICFDVFLSACWIVFKMPSVFPQDCIFP